jgi:hypothetical protein
MFICSSSFAWYAQRPMVHGRMTEDNAAYRRGHGSSAKHNKAYCQSGMADDNAAYPHGGEA